MTISTGNYDGEGVNRHMFPARTVSGEVVQIVEKVLGDDGVVRMLSEDGRKFVADVADSLNLHEVFDAAQGVVQDAGDSIEETLGEAAADAKEVAEDAAQAVNEAAQDAVEQIGDIAGDALDAVGDLLGGGDDGEAPEAA